jgi:hypothetical protein
LRLELGRWATEEQKRKGWEMAVRIEKIICTVPNEAHQRQIEETMDTPSEGPGLLYPGPLSPTE